MDVVVNEVIDKEVDKEMTKVVWRRSTRSWSMRSMKV